MTYIESVQKALGVTTSRLMNTAYEQGWWDLEDDLDYAISLKSETAIREHLHNWLEVSKIDVKWDANTQGYVDRVVKINELIQSYSDNQS